MIQPLSYTAGGLTILDQTALPGQVVYRVCTRWEEVAEAITTLQLRGAPLIGLAAAFALVLARQTYQPAEGELIPYLKRVSAELYATRPTAVNLDWALRRMEQVFTGTDGSREILEHAAQALLTEDVETNRRIGQLGADIFAANDLKIMTICNAGALATGGYGTALGVIRALRERGQLSMVWANETRPVLQGARLTVWELREDGVPVTLITDNMAAQVLRSQAIDAVITGADRIAANGDTANKIGSYALAILADYHGIPFYVAAPESTCDAAARTGAEIPIEQRSAEEVRCLGGQLITCPEVQVYNPAFDVVPHQLITALITEKGVREVK
jgi:methylthioribose-1-phosphate isomerase